MFVQPLTEILLRERTRKGVSGRILVGVEEQAAEGKLADGSAQRQAFAVGEALKDHQLQNREIHAALIRPREPPARA